LQSASSSSRFRALMRKGTFFGIGRSSLVHFRKSVSAIGFRHFSDQEIDALAVEIMMFFPELSG
jgi:hypothetical protein